MANVCIIIATLFLILVKTKTSSAYHQKSEVLKKKSYLTVLYFETKFIK